MRINKEARLRALKIAFFTLGMVALLAIFPARMLPNLRPGEVLVDPYGKGGKPDDD